MIQTKHVNPADVRVHPSNPRIIKDAAFKKLVQSLLDFPEMSDVRPIVANADGEIIGGNMRFRAMIEAGWETIPVIVVDWDVDKQQEFMIKDNVQSGEWDWDSLANEWDSQTLIDWNMDIPDVSAASAGSGFEPNVQPIAGNADVTAAEIEKKARELADQMSKEKKNLPVICPSCAHEFEVQA